MAEGSFIDCSQELVQSFYVTVSEEFPLDKKQNKLSLTITHQDLQPSLDEAKFLAALLLMFLFSVSPFCFKFQKF